MDERCRRRPRGAFLFACIGYDGSAGQRGEGRAHARRKCVAPHMLLDRLHVYALLLGYVHDRLQGLLMDGKRCARSAEYRLVILGKSLVHDFLEDKARGRQRMIFSGLKKFLLLDKIFTIAYV